MLIKAIQYCLYLCVNRILTNWSCPVQTKSAEALNSFAWSSEMACRFLFEQYSVIDDVFRFALLPVSFRCAIPRMFFTRECRTPLCLSIGPGQCHRRGHSAGRSFNVEMRSTSHRTWFHSPICNSCWFCTPLSAAGLHSQADRIFVAAL